MEHHVYFWLKDDLRTPENLDLMERALEKLCTSPNIASARWGSPAPTEPRPVTDHSWDYGISLKFDSLPAHDAYQNNDPIHDEFISCCKPLWERVLVMDLA